MKKILVVNAGSSSLKFKLYLMPSEEVLCSGIAERIMHEDAIFQIKINQQSYKEVLPISDHKKAVHLLVDALKKHNIIQSFDEIAAIGHRVVQGGKYYNKSVIFDESVAEKVHSLIDLAPLHNGPNLTGYRAFKEILPNIPNVATFDTAFHRSMAEEDFVFPIPYELTTKYDLYRYGFHGTSHEYLAIEGAKLLGQENLKIITCHIGSGASISAVKNGKCVATSMGLTPLGGIMMGTRTGDIDPSIVYFLCHKLNKDIQEVYDILNKKSGLLGVSGVSNDARDVDKAKAKGNERAILAQRLFIRRIADYIGQYFVRLGGADLIIFSAGIGENSHSFRQNVIKEISSALEIDFNEEINKNSRAITTLLTNPSSKVHVALIPTDEEVMIARDTFRLI
ncbi:MAG: acetate kinase [Bacilli bacterium]|jgi:acetate kinase|nr:acetate kinase [Bacilli bacterium]NLN80712.1 acetate kinase [Erysipelotrichia bacterium]